jgi:hypothetical protein
LESSSSESAQFCPSAQPDMPDGVVFGIVRGTANEPRVTYLADPLPVTAEVLALAEPVHPTEVFRIGARCARHGCQHYDGERCRLVQQLVEQIPPAASQPPACRLRPRCRWWLEQGTSACLRCPVIVTEQPNPTEVMAAAAKPHTRSDNEGQIDDRISEPTRTSA